MSSKISLQVAIVVPLVIQMVGAVGAVGYFSFRNGQRAIDDLAHQLMDNVSDRITQQLTHHLETPRVINQLNTDTIALGQADPQDVSSLTRSFWKQRFLFDSMSVSALYFGSTQGDFVGLGFQSNGNWEVGRSDRSTNRRFQSYAIDAEGNPTTLLATKKPYDPRQRPWYQAAVTAKQPIWSPIYLDFAEQRPKITLAQPLYKSGKLRGVIGTDFVLSHVGEFLKRLEVGRTGKTFVIERSGALVASSADRQTLLDGQKKRLAASESDDRLIRSTAQHLQQQFGTVADIDSSQQLSFRLDDQRQLVKVAPFADRFGLDWLIVVVVPESDFMATINANTQKTLWLCLIALGIAIGLGILAARSLTRPILRLVASSQKIAQGEFDKPIKIGGIQELNVLATSFNHMSGEIQQSRLRLEDYARSLEQKVYDRTQALEKEVQERQQAEEIANQSNAEMQALFKAMDQLIFVYDRHGRHLKIPSTGRKTLMYRPSGIRLGKALHEIFPSEIADRFSGYILQTLETQTTLDVEYKLTINGQEIWSDASISPIDENSVVWVARNVTDRKLAEQELKQAKLTADAASRAKSEFLANMSHELRSPLNAILGFAQLMQRSTRSPDELENLDIITRSGEHLLALINSVLDLSKIEAGQTTLTPTDFDLDYFLDDLSAMFHLRAVQKNLRMVVDRAPNTPRFLRADQTKLRQILINLLSNAIKFTTHGTITLSVSSPLHCSRLTPHASLSFEVKDTGAGIPPIELDTIFQAFVQTEIGKAAREGTGLGLSISQKFVQLMGGEITVQSEVNKGTCFAFHIPVSVVEAAQVKSQQPPQRVVALQANQPLYRILVVDDAVINRRLLVKLLVPLGFEVREASDGQAAIALSHQWEPHLIWMDMRMPILDGYEATRQIKSTTQGQAIAIIALTASVLEEERSVILSAGCDDFVRKPFRESDIFAIMQKHLGVEYIYADTVSDQVYHSIQEVLTIESFSLLPSEWILDLKQALLNVDLELAARAIDQIKTQNPDLAFAIQACIDRFDYEQVLGVIP
ncbi:ATP-binding protein [Phormidesmis sp. 146-12]